MKDSGKVTGGTSSESFYAVVDPSSAPAHPGWHECRTDSNASATVTAATFCGSGRK